MRDAITELGYRPDRRARDLAARSAARLVGFVQVDAANPFFAAVYRGLEDATREAGLLVIAASTDADPDREVAVIETMIESRVDGFVVAAAEGSDELLRREILQGTPVVCVDRVLAGSPCATVVSTNRDSAREAVAHLLALGHRRIAFLGGDQRVWTASERLAGYEEALNSSGGGVDPLLVRVSVGDLELAAAATRALLGAPRPPTAIFAAQDRITIGAVTALHELGRHHEIALFGFDEIPFAEQLEPSVSVVAQDPYEMGRRAGGLMLQAFAGPVHTDAARVVVAAPLRHRASGAIRPAG